MFFLILRHTKEKNQSIYIKETLTLFIYITKLNTVEKEMFNFNINISYIS